MSRGADGLSYAGQFNILAVGDADAHPDVEVFTASARNELQDSPAPVTPTR